MQKPISTKQRDILNTQENVDQDQNKENYSLIERHIIENSPFMAIRLEDNWFLVMGDHRITDDYNTKEEAVERLVIEKWRIIALMVLIMIQDVPLLTQIMKVNEIEELKERLKERL